MFIPYLSDNHKDKQGISLIGSDQVWDIPTLKLKTWISLTNADQEWDIPKTCT